MSDPPTVPTCADCGGHATYGCAGRCRLCLDRWYEAERTDTLARAGVRPAPAAPLVHLDPAETEAAVVAATAHLTSQAYYRGCGNYTGD